MYTPQPYEKPKPRYAGLVVCDNRQCEAQYRPADENCKWFRGTSEGTTGNFNPRSQLPDNCCPLCGHDNSNQEIK